MGVRARAALRLIFAISILTGAAVAQLARYDGFVAPAGYNFGPATIAVCQNGGSGGPPCTPLALVYSDPNGTSQIQQPFSADMNGHYYFYAPAGAYVTDTYGSGYATTLTNITLGSTVPSLSGSNTWTGAQKICKGNGVAYIDPSNACGWSGSDFSAWVASAISYLGAGGGKIQLGSGTYVPTATVNASAPVALAGASQATTIIQPAANPTFDVITVTSSNVSFSNLTVDGNASAESAYSGIKLTDGAHSISGVSLDHVTVQNAGNYCFGWNNTSGSPSNVSVTNSTLQNCGLRLYYANWVSGNTTSASNFTISNSTLGSTTVWANDPTPSGFYAPIAFLVNGTGAVSQVVINNNQILFPVIDASHETDGIVLDGSPAGGGAGGMSQVTISNNVITGPVGVTPVDGHGLEMVGVYKVTVGNNYFGPAYNGLLLQQATGVTCGGTISGNVFDNPLSTNVTASITAPNSGGACPATFQGNTVDTTGTGILVNVGAVTVSSNYFKDEGTTNPAVQLQCTITGGCLSNSVTGNIFHGVAGGTLLMSNGSTAFKNLAIVGNTFDSSYYGIEFISTLDSGYMSANVFSGMSSPYYIVPAGMREVGSNNLTGSCTGTATSSQTLGLYGTGPNVTATTCTSTTIGSGAPMNYSGTLQYMKATATHAGVNASSGVVTVLKNGAATAITCTIGTGTSCEDRTDTVAFVAGDLISIEFTTQATEVLAGVNATVMQVN